MYIISRHPDYESPDFLAAYADEATAIAEAEKMVAASMDEWDVPKARGAVGGAANLGPALTAVAFWRVYDNYDYVVYKVNVTAEAGH